MDPAAADLALQRLFETNFDQLVRALSIAAGDRGRAEDAVQDAFTQAYLHWGRIHDYDDPVAWLRRVATNRILNQRRSHSRRRAAIDDLRATPAMGASRSFETSLAGRVDLAAAVRSLPVQQRTSVALYYYADLPVSAAADAMGLSEGAVRFHLHAARRSLLAALEEPQ